MSTKDDAYTIDGTCFLNIRNRNELRVIKEIRAILDREDTLPLSCKDWQDVYALALNALSPRYTQSGTIVLRDPVHKDDIAKVVQDAITFVHAQPKI
ncbi:MAG: late competence development ComFB family protein [Desulfovibrionaceae bacterium]